MITKDKEAPLSVYVATASLIWSVLVTLPMWFVMTYAILARIDSPPWLWGLFYAYIPTCFTAYFLQYIWKVLRSQEGTND